MFLRHLLSLLATNKQSLGLGGGRKPMIPFIFIHLNASQSTNYSRMKHTRQIKKKIIGNEFFLVLFVSTLRSVNIRFIKGIGRKEFMFTPRYAHWKRKRINSKVKKKSIEICMTDEDIHISFFCKFFLTIVSFFVFFK